MFKPGGRRRPRTSGGIKDTWLGGAQGGGGAGGGWTPSLHGVAHRQARPKAGLLAGNVPGRLGHHVGVGNLRLPPGVLFQLVGLLHLALHT